VDSTGWPRETSVDFRLAYSQGPDGRFPVQCVYTLLTVDSAGDLVTIDGRLDSRSLHSRVAKTGPLIRRPQSKLDYGVRKVLDPVIQVQHLVNHANQLIYWDLPNEALRGAVPYGAFLISIGVLFAGD
jgi:hypothetical protein